MHRTCQLRGVSLLIHRTEKLGRRHANIIGAICVKKAHILAYYACADEERLVINGGTSENTLGKLSIERRRCVLGLVQVSEELERVFRTDNQISNERSHRKNPDRHNQMLNYFGFRSTDPLEKQLHTGTK